MSHYTYILKCSDDSFYVGSTNDIGRRIKEHNYAKKGAHYTKIRRPVRLVYFETFTTQREARGREALIKGLKRKQKLELIEFGQ